MIVSYHHGYHHRSVSALSKPATSSASGSHLTANSVTCAEIVVAAAVIILAAMPTLTKSVSRSCVPTRNAAVYVGSRAPSASHATRSPAGSKKGIRVAALERDACRA